jgi:hypothetical protein
MNTLLPSSFRLAALAALLSFPLLVSGAETPVPDSAAQLLARHGQVTVLTAGPYVQPGTYRIQVSAKLGQPDARLPDGTWLYHHRRIDGSDAGGTLVVRFTQGRVQSLTIATPAVVAALRQAAPKPGTPAHDLLATK